MKRPSNMIRKLFSKCGAIATIPVPIATKYKQINKPIRTPILSKRIPPKNGTTIFGTLYAEYNNPNSAFVNSNSCKDVIHQFKKKNE